MSSKFFPSLIKSAQTNSEPVLMSALWGLPSWLKTGSVHRIPDGSLSIQSYIFSLSIINREKHTQSNRKDSKRLLIFRFLKAWISCQYLPYVKTVHLNLNCDLLNKMRRQINPYSLFPAKGICHLILHIRIKHPFLFSQKFYWIVN